MSRVIANPRQPLDHRGDPRQRPELGGKAMGARTLSQRGVDTRQLPMVQPRLAPGPAGTLQRRSTFRFPGVIPPMRRHAAHAEGPGDGRLRLASGEQPRGLEPSRLQRSKIPTSSGHGTASPSTP